ncbi:uncharacterized protein Bfra_002339 [Botrytis fragariae]|uniref:Uncharacterized protein n=1 Tax=Botrytis fragariae TaxID=1964551 RepID=A0A8H6EKU5_9HELO|nr:uncharacterized protein Bfra_002339 [Botrytis fragariae]KAF5875943.1 hypothetical protein Bfra_002339 [Botrytis fragariae]
MSLSFEGLKPEEFQILEQEKIIGASINGKRKVSTGLLSPDHSDGSTTSSLSSGSTASIRVLHKAAASVGSFELPESLECLTLVEYLGYTRTKAAEIFTRWTARPDPDSNPYSLKDHALVELSNLEREPLRDFLDRPAEAMRRLGIAEEMVNCMTAPEHKAMFKTETLAAWLDTAMRSRYGTAMRYLDILKAQAIRTIRLKKGKKRGKIDGVFQPGGSTPDTDVALATSTASMSLESKFAGEMFPREYVTIVQTPPQARPGFVTLYKGKSTGFDYQKPTTLIKENGNLNMQFITTYAGGDFNGQDLAWYWTREKETAEQYREWAAKYDVHGETWIMQIQVPETFLQSVKIERLWYGYDWKQYLWYCKKMTRNSDLPENLHKYATADVMEGHICKRHPSIVPKILKQDVQRKLTEDDCLVFGNGRNSTQTVFMNWEVVDRLEPLIRGNMYIEVHLASVKQA